MFEGPPDFLNPLVMAGFTPAGIAAMTPMDVHVREHVLTESYGQRQFWPLDPIAPDPITPIRICLPEPMPKIDFNASFREQQEKDRKIAEGMSRWMEQQREEERKAFFRMQRERDQETFGFTLGSDDPPRRKKTKCPCGCGLEF